MTQRTFNICHNWRLFCIEMKETNGGVRLSCKLNGKKREDGTYPNGVSVSVMCLFETCDIPEADYNKKYIDVDGGITISEYTNKDGETKSTLTLFADKVRIHEWD